MDPAVIKGRVTMMSGDTTITQTALVLIATAVCVQTVLMLVGAWFVMRAWRETQEALERHSRLLQAHVETLSQSARDLMQTVDHGAARVSSVFTTGEQVIGAVASLAVTPKVVLLARLAGTVVSKWRGRRPRLQVPR